MRLLEAALLAATITCSCLAAEAATFEPPGFAMREYFPLDRPGTTWRFEDGDSWVELTARGVGQLDGESTLTLDAVSDGVPVGTRHFTAEGPLAALYVAMPGGGGMDFREDPLAYSTGPRAYVGDRLTAAPRSFAGGEIMMTTEILGSLEVTVPAGTYPEALRLHTTMTHLPTGTVISEFDTYYARGVGMIWTHGTDTTEQGPRSYDQKLVEIRAP